MASPLIQFRAITPMDKDLEARTEQLDRVSDAQKDRLLSETARRDLERYYKALDYTLYTINLSYKEAMVIIDALNGYLMTPELPHLLVHNVRDAIEMDGLDEKWGVDGKAFIVRLKQLSPMDCLALNDAVERWWNTTTYHTSEEDETHEQRCIRVGLIRQPRKELTPDN